jgi:hypothetical protein
MHIQSEATCSRGAAPGTFIAVWNSFKAAMDEDFPEPVVLGSD